MVPSPHLFAASAEAASVIVAAGLVWLAAGVQHFSNIAQRGTSYVLSDRSVSPDMTGFFGRATRTLANNVESALMYVPAALIVIVAGKANSLSHWAAIVYIAARLIFVMSYWLKIPNIRSFAWLTGMTACAVLYGVAVG
ncbi:MAG TPA: MAPEG family protein [Asticcacaulis sp.]|nr:MAPEG family protein [Asticcacaulis sp.]